MGDRVEEEVRTQELETIWDHDLGTGVPDGFKPGALLAFEQRPADQNCRQCGPSPPQERSVLVFGEAEERVHIRGRHCRQMTSKSQAWRMSQRSVGIIIRD